MTAVARTPSFVSPAGNPTHPVVTSVTAVPVITALSPAPSGLGQVITITGTDLGTATNVTVNGVSSFYTISNNTATSITFRVPTTTPATGAGVVVTTAGGTSAAFAFTLMAAPGNALDFVKGTSYTNVKVLQPFTGDFTIEFWMNTTATGGTGTYWTSGAGLVDADQSSTKADFGVSLLGTKVAFGIGNTSSAPIPNINPTITSVTSVNDGRWHHVAATRAVSGALCTLTLYIDGILEATATNNAIAPRTTVTYTGLAIGQILSSVTTTTTGQAGFYTGRLDEVRLWTVARTGSDIQNNYRSVLAGPQLYLAAYYNFDGGTASGSNAGLNTLYDIANPVNFVPVFGLMTGFALTGATSNWEESYAMVVPTATAATAVSSTGFTANWTAPALGVVTGYYVDVSTVSTFASVITGSPFSVAAPALTKTVTGLTAGTYYYRVRADKTTTPVTQGGPSNIITTVPSSVATLGTLTMSAGPLAPTFAAGTSSYSFTTSASTTTVTPTLTTGAATAGNPSPGSITVNGTNVPSGTTSGAIPLVVGTNTITVLGTAQDGVSTSSYTVTVTRCSFQAVAKSITVALDATGSVATTVTTATIDNGSTVGCATSPGTTSTLALTAAITCTDATPASTINKSLAFSGTQYVDGTHPLLPQGSAARTLEAWVYPTVTSTSYALIFNYGSPSPNLRSGLGIYNGRLVYTAEFNDVYSGTVLALNAWHHVAATYDGTTLKLYVDGVLDLTNTPITFATAGLGWRIGQRVAPVVSGENLTGRVDEVRVWNRPLTAAEIASSAGRTNPASLLGLVARWNLDEGSGTVVNDVTGNSTAGTLSTATATWNTSGVPYQGVMANLTLTDASGTVSRAQSTVTVQDNTAPTAITRTVVATAGANGRLYVAPSAVNNASTDNCTLTTTALSASTFGCGASSALAFDGLGGYVNLPAMTTAQLATLTSFTFEAWVNYTDNGFWVRIMDIGGGTGGNFMYLAPKAYGGGLPTFVIHMNGGVEESLVATAAMPTGWHHLAVTLNRTANVVGTMYLDGVVVATNNAMTLSPSYLGAMVNNYLGRSEFTSDPFFSGQLDEVRIWNTARTAAEINLYKDKSVDATSTGLLVYYEANDGTGTTVFNRGSNAGVGTLMATTPPSSTTTGALPTFATPGQVPAMSATGPQTVTLTMTDRVGNVSTATATITPPTTITWTGAISTDWTDCRNWTYGKSPDATTSVTIPTGMPFYPNLPAGTFPVLNLTINSGGSLTVASGATLQLSGSFTNNGTASLAGTVAFAGSAAQTIGGSSATAFSTLTVNNTTSTVQLMADLPVTSALTLTAGTLSTGAFKVALGSAATLTGESETSYIIGNVEVTHNLATAGTADNFGSLGLTLTPNSASTVLPGSTLVRRVTGTAPTGVSGSTGVTRYFVITPTVNTGLNVAMDFAYFNHELNSIPTANLAMFKTATGTTGPWAAQRAATLAPNLLNLTGITDFSVWTLGNTAAPLPVELSAFTARADGATAVRLDWATATEKNSASFEVERSANGKLFNNIGAVPAAGNSTGPRAYTFRDEHLTPAPTTLYYRLHLVDADGFSTYSPVRNVALAAAPGSVVALYPNPAHSTATLSNAGPGTYVQVLDALGRQVTATTADAVGSATLVLPQGLASGVYVVRAGPKAIRLTVE